MAKLYFRHGTMGSAKTLNLLAVAHNYRAQSKRILLLKPQLDTRFGTHSISSRSGLSADADVLIAPETDIKALGWQGISCVLVDEAQFLNRHHVDQLRYVATHLNIPVICYGLRTDFCRELFPGSKRLLELCDSIEEVKTTCIACNSKAIFNFKRDRTAVTSGLDVPRIELGGDEKYSSVCSACFDRLQALDTRQTKQAMEFQRENNL